MSRDVVLLDLFTCCVAPASSNQMGSRPRITRDMIGDPLRDSFQHVAHVGAAEVGEVDSVEPFKSRFAPSSSPQSSSESSSRLPSPTAASGATSQQQQMLKMNLDVTGHVPRQPSGIPGGDWPASPSGKR